MNRRSLIAGAALVGLVPMGAEAACDDADEANKAVALRWIDEVWNQGNINLLDEIVADDFSADSPIVIENRDAWKQEIAASRAQFVGLIPDVKYTVDEAFAADGRVCLRGRITGTGITQKTVAALYINILSFKDGRITSWWGAQDDAALMAAL